MSEDVPSAFVKDICAADAVPISIVSVPAVVVTETNPVPETVSVSVAESATIFDCPETAIFLNASVTLPLLTLPTSTIFVQIGRAHV